MSDAQWENVFSTWSTGPGKTEDARCQNAITAIQNAINSSNKLNKSSIKPFVQGSYRNRVNIQKDSDVDVGVLYMFTFHYDLPEGRSKEDFNIVPSNYHYEEFKRDLFETLVGYFGDGKVEWGNKALKIHETTYHVDADVVPLFEYRQYFDSGQIRKGVSLRPDNGGKIDNFPEILIPDWPDTPLHYENGVQKNRETNRRYKRCVRIVKNLRAYMGQEGSASADAIPNYLVECLLFNLPNPAFTGTTWLETIRRLFALCWEDLSPTKKAKVYMEVDNIKYLFHESQPWTKEQALSFVSEAWEHIGVK